MRESETGKPTRNCTVVDSFCTKSSWRRVIWKVTGVPTYRATIGSRIVEGRDKGCFRRVRLRAG